MLDYDIIDPRFHEIVLASARLETLAEGFGWVEGPVWFGDHRCLLFSDIPNDRVMRWSAAGGVEVFREPANFENGHTRDWEGRLLSCSHRGRCITRTEIDGRLTVLADHWQGKRLNSPNDVVVKSDGTIWFTDPPYGIETDYQGGKQEAELPARIYRLDPRAGALTIVADDFQGPNGLCFSPDERLLYATETGNQFSPAPDMYIRVFDVADDGASLRNGRVFYAPPSGAVDGVRCDDAGNLWVAASDGAHCLTPDSDLLGKINVPSGISNLTFGDRNRSRLFLCGGQAVYAVYVNRRGVELP